jgi:acyl-CoA thioesterase-1
MGTSLTAGLGLDPEEAFPVLVQQTADSAGVRLDAINAGVSGETSAAALRRIDWLLQQPFDVFVLETGANDGLRGLRVDSTKANIDEIIRRVQKARPGAPVLLVQMEAPPNFGAGYTTPFRDMFPAIAKARGAVLVPFLLNGVAGVARLNQSDGIHPNPEGERMVAATVWRALAPVVRACCSAAPHA